MEGKMKKLFSIISTFLFTCMLTSFGFATEENLKKLSIMYKSGDTNKAIVVPQDTKFAANIKKNILPNIKMPSGFSIELFAVVPDARHMAFERNKTTVWIGTRKDKVWQATDRDMDDIADTVEQFAPTVKFDIPNGVCFSDDVHR